MTAFKFRVVLPVCPIRPFPTLISKIKWLGSELPLNQSLISSVDVPSRTVAKYNPWLDEMYKNVQKMYEKCTVLSALDFKTDSTKS